MTAPQPTKMIKIGSNTIRIKFADDTLATNTNHSFFIDQGEFASVMRIVDGYIAMNMFIMAQDGYILDKHIGVELLDPRTEFSIHSIMLDHTVTPNNTNLWGTMNLLHTDQIPEHQELEVVVTLFGTLPNHKTTIVPTEAINQRGMELFSMIDDPDVDTMIRINNKFPGRLFIRSEFIRNASPIFHKMFYDQDRLIDNQFVIDGIHHPRNYEIVVDCSFAIAVPLTKYLYTNIVGIPQFSPHWMPSDDEAVAIGIDNIDIPPTDGQMEMASDLINEAPLATAADNIIWWAQFAKIGIRFGLHKLVQMCEDAVIDAYTLDTICGVINEFGPIIEHVPTIAVNISECIPKYLKEVSKTEAFQTVDPVLLNLFINYPQTQAQLEH